MRFFAFLLALIVLFVIGFILKVEVKFHYRRMNQDDYIEMCLSGLGSLWQFKLKIPGIELEWEKGPEIKVEQRSESQLSETRQQKMKMRFRFWWGSFFYRIWPNIFNLAAVISRVKRKFYRSIHLTDLKFYMEIGFSDPFYTALAYGGVWSVIGNSVARLYRQVQIEVKNPQIQIIPRFQNPGLACDFFCIFKLRIGHIIFAGLRLLGIFKWSLRG